MEIMSVGLFVYLCISPIIYLIMQLTHIAIWTNELERSRDFYVKYFGGKSNEKYVNPKKGIRLLFCYLRGCCFSGDHAADRYYR